MGKKIPFFKKNALILLLVGIPLFLFLFISIFFKSHSNIWVFPFNVEIWGTVSDWFMVWVTAITAIYLIKTFKEQQRLTEIENYDYKEKIKPEFKIVAEIDHFSVDLDNTAKAIVSLIIYVRNYNAYNVKITTDKVLDTASLPFTLPEENYKIIYKDDSISIPYLKFNICEKILSIKQDFIKKEYVDDGFLYFRLKFRFDFSDFEHTTYFQEIEISANNNKEIECFSTPVLPN
ncbi:hypothetical protein [Cyclobacterium plantarum]|uniref:SMODS-associating 2TM beta-strand rich effector domain-containing protein n=1 Tax=Cyclobacterium plantarum TaxID=2716263 RepID=A0ABX0H7S8_9BACT|nr:hypothetical protein [Cyclobacterium plantarum]NHE57945.1 hypothetical protein [Cyclobacterium plantarum]